MTLELENIMQHNMYAQFCREARKAGRLDFAQASQLKRVVRIGMVVDEVAHIGTERRWQPEQEQREERTKAALLLEVSKWRAGLCDRTGVDGGCVRTEPADRAR